MVTPDIDLSQGGQIQFYLRIGGGSCGKVLSRSSGEYHPVCDDSKADSYQGLQGAVILIKRNCQERDR